MKTSSEYANLAEAELRQSRCTGFESAKLYIERAKVYAELCKIAARKEAE